MYAPMRRFKKDVDAIKCTKFQYINVCLSKCSGNDTENTYMYSVVLYKNI